MPYPLARFRAYACEPFFSLQMHRTMPQPRSALLNWLYAFVPQSMNTHPREWLRAGLGAGLGVLLTTWLCHQLFGPTVAAQLVGPLGASAVLLFAVSSGMLAQPWSIIGGGPIGCPLHWQFYAQCQHSGRFGPDPHVPAALPAPAGWRCGVLCCHR